MTPIVRPARSDEVRSAFELLFRNLPLAERAYRTAKALELIGSGELDVRGVLVAPRGVFVCQPVAGGGGLVWPPVVEGSSPEVIEDQLIETGCAWLRERGARLVQCLLAEEEAPLSRSLLRNGFTHVTGLTYLRHDLDKESLRAEPLVPLKIERYDPAQPSAFHETLSRTYEGSLDCPEVNGKRSIEEVILGHQSQGGYDPSRWWLLRRSSCDEPSGVLLVVQPIAGEWEISYVGIVPESRRLGIARSALLLLLHEARAQQIARVTLSVDDRNFPADKLYRQLGFKPYDHRRVLLRLF